jgi:hypothetical protein
MPSIGYGEARPDDRLRAEAIQGRLGKLLWIASPLSRLAMTLAAK